MKFLVNILLVQLWILVFAILINCDEFKVTKYDKSFKKLVTRRKRYSVFPPASGVIITFQFAKSLMMNYPRGINLVAEADFYYPLQTKLSDWIPPKNLFHFHDALTQYDVHKDQLVHNDHLDQTVQYDDDNIVADNTTKSDQIDLVDYPWWYNHNRNSELRRMYYIDEKPSYVQPIQIVSYSHRIKPAHKNNHFQRVKNNRFSISQRNGWDYYHGHRHRRDLYELIEKFAGSYGQYTLKDCILRTICEARHYLLPPGVSLFQDILRLLFTVPLKDGIKDKYSEAMELKGGCGKVFGFNCPISFLGFLIANTPKPGYVTQ